MLRMYLLSDEQVIQNLHEITISIISYSVRSVTLGLSNDFVIRSALTNVDPVTLQPVSDGRGKSTDPKKVIATMS